ncbi:energy transducer TonB family protein [Sphingomonas aerophila]|uniref:TonB family protein n=1 Tax=Sphingomonas aerophila TaxID=1344948 RepID=A0A7W9B9U6_9SPHN|nr:TonB family protein [Sphingomonas aerophila]MBB5713265.1 TonB family protein [Sphingomonas aerophila]
MKHHLIAAVCAAVLSTVPAASDAGPVRSSGTSDAASNPVTFKAWQVRVQRELAHRLHYLAPILGRSAGSGVVRVNFNCSESGRPDKVTLAQSSGSQALDRAALFAVRKMASMHPLPSSFNHEQKFAALIYFDDGLGTQSDSKLKDMMASADKANGWIHDPVAAAQGPAPVLSIVHG